LAKGLGGSVRAVPPAFDAARATALAARSAAADDAVASTQVLIELFHAPTRKQRTRLDVAQALTHAHGAWPVVGSDATLVNAAIERSIRDRLSIWDAEVIDAALRFGAQTPFSEELQRGRRIGGLTIVNPFLTKAGAN
jgi:predicted nucleic acid-binding protein